MTFYTYMWLRADATPYYVGKGHGDRAFTSRGHGVHRPKESARILVQFWSSEQEAFDMEKFYIRLFGRKDNGTGILRNRTDGGEGCLLSAADTARRNAAIKAAYTTERREEQRQKMLGNKHSLGFIPSEESKKRMRLAKLGKNKSAETRRRMSAAKKGNKDGLGHFVSATTRQKLHDANKGQGLGRKLSAVTRERMGVARRGKSIATKGKPWSAARRSAHDRKVATCQ
jgi:hypothetical protein